MKKTKLVVFRVTSFQYEQLRRFSMSKGYVEIAKYIRYLIFDKGALVEHKVLENNRLLYEIKEKINKTYPM